MHEWDAFDRALRDTATELPPAEETVRAVMPFRTAVRRVVTGLCLTFFTVNVWYLQYLLPALGTLLIYLGFRSLRNNNRYFRICWIISICEVILLYIDTALLALGLLDMGTIGWPSLLLRFLLLLCLHLALRRAAADVGRHPLSSPAAWAMVWYVLLVALGLFWPSSGWIAFLGMGIAFVCIVVSLLRMAAQLSEWGYGVRAAPVRSSAGRLAAGCMFALLVLALSLSLTANHLPAESAAVETPASETGAIRSHLEELGFPAECLSLLPEEELFRLEDADLCSVSLDAWGDSTDNGVRYTDIQVRVGPQTFRCYHFFTVDTKKAVFQNLLTVEPDDKGESVSDQAGQILWKENGILYAAALRLTASSYADPLWGGSRRTFSALFSYPFFSQDRQGWAAYSITFPDEQLGACAILRYQTQSWRYLFPYAPLPEQPVVGMLNDLESQSYSLYYTAPEEAGPSEM